MDNLANLNIEVEVKLDDGFIAQPWFEVVKPMFWFIIPLKAKSLEKAILMNKQLYDRSLKDLILEKNDGGAPLTLRYSFIRMHAAASKIVNSRSKFDEESSLEETLSCYKVLVAEFPILEIEGPFEYDNWRLQKAIKKTVCGSFIVKVDYQIDWTITKCIEAVKHSDRAGWGLVMGHHISCETTDTSIADLCIALAMYLLLGKLAELDEAEEDRE
ncbi:hypothetical protein TIFTF001_019861 [Ficus carica]|uniref:phosphopyruvate hydratase n=1 Tax=Ficus carica TaxID=3494 RepID=A0AA88DAH0_FICCA|nr:hypothetical protein TIFTF001_019861 [Ficus carica]